MARQSFIWTALPNGYTPDGTSLQLSVILSPRLNPETNTKKLSSFFPEWKDWPKTLLSARFDVTYNGQTVSVAGNAITGPTRVDNRLGLPDSAVWQALFKADLFVRPFEFRDLSDHSVLSYDTVAVAGLIETLYRDLARRADGNMPLVSNIVDDPNWASLARILDELDLASVDRATGLRDPSKQFEDFPAAEPGGANLPLTLQRFQLFHTPPCGANPRHEPRLDDERIPIQWLEHKPSPLPAKADLTKELDFHQIVAAMGSYPTLLRRLGLVVDLLVPSGSFPVSANAALSVSVSFLPGTLQVTHTKDAQPVTRAQLTTKKFQAVSDAAAAFRVKDGLLDLDPARFRLLQFDVDGAGLKVINFVRSLGRRRPDESRVDAVTRHEDELGAPALRTAGLMLVHRDRWFFLKGRFGKNDTGNTNLESQFTGGANTVSLHAEDLVRGYRLDIWDSTTARWRSLCRRTARYELDDAAVVVEPVAGEEEGTVRLGATKSIDKDTNPKLLYLHEALASWTGWSLAAPPPGRSIRPNDSVDTTTAESEAEVPPGLKFKSRFRAVKHSLPRLRFGRAYAIRARSVDLAGNSLPPQAEDFGPEQPNDHAQSFLRYEPVAAPVLALRSQAGAIEKPAEGESMARIAIRSFNNTPADNTVATSQLSRRVAAPPQVSVRDAEQHGMLDSGGKVSSGTFNLLANQKDVDPRQASAAIREEKLQTQGPLGQPSETTFAVYETGRALTYLPDPYAQEIAARTFDHPNIADSEVITIPLYPAGDWPEAQPFTIEVYDQPTEKPYFDPSTRQLRMPLPKGVRAKVRLSMKLDLVALSRMGVFALMTDADKAAQQARALDGQHWMLTPWREVDVVHAVQRPLMPPEIVSVAIPRAARATSVEPRITATCSVDTTDRLDLFAEWHEPTDDPEQPDSAAQPADRQRRDAAFQVKITDPKTYALRLFGARAGGHPDHTLSAQDVIEINAFKNPPKAAPIVPVKAHEFHDTRYRRIEYWFTATTRFREYLPPSLLTTTNGDGQTVPTEAHITVTGQRVVSWVPSSAPPPSPRVLYVVPTFGWTRTVEADGTRTSRRNGGGLRVYLDRPWNASGYGEMLGVVLPPAGFTGDPDTVPDGQPYKKYVTQWGNDPIWDSPFVAGIAPGRGDFPRARFAPDATGSWLPPQAPATERDQRPGPFQVTGLRPAGPDGVGGEVEVAPHDVFYDGERRLWYCDIDIKASASYFPFVRLALARYQPTSVSGTHLSTVVLADFMTLAVDRWLSVTPTDESRTRRVTVFGFRAWESSGHHEAGSAVPMAESTVVEVWVERLDQRLGEDFGWRPVGGAVVSGGEPSASTLGGLPIARTVVDLVIGSVTPWQPLWEGSVTLPATPGRYRLVVAEYEEYLIDDANPYDKVPTRKGRRLVFVEHVELG